MCCGVIPILFGQFLRVPSLHALVFILKIFLSLFNFQFESCLPTSSLLGWVIPLQQGVLFPVSSSDHSKLACGEDYHQHKFNGDSHTGYKLYTHICQFETNMPGACNDETMTGAMK